MADKPLTLEVCEKTKKVPDTIAYLSTLFTLEAGDLILAGCTMTGCDAAL